MPTEILTKYVPVVRLETSLHLLAITKLVQAAENVLLRQRKIQVLSEFKQAAVTHRRCKKVLESEGCGFGDLATDNLIVIFGHLDARSLASAASVCRLWNRVASDEMLWAKLFRNSFSILTSQKVYCSHGGLRANHDQPINWRVLFGVVVSSMWFSSL
ncbi:hypothetical protein L7F22_066489 [Adiantum nelumboides]|nr:hypothetical protein [Adiantum nelumboides]